MEGIFSWVRNVVIFVLVLSLIEEILPDEDYRKYIRAVAGMVFILVVFSPLLELFNVRGSVDYFFQWESFKTAFSGSDLADGGNFDGDALEQERQALVLNEYEAALKEQIRVLVENQGYGVKEVGISVEDNEDSENFGAVKAIVVCLHPEADGIGSGDAGLSEDAGRSEKTITAVEPVVIGSDSDGENVADTEKAAVSMVPATGEKYVDLRRLLSENYGVHMNYISIVFEGGDRFE